MHPQVIRLKTTLSFKQGGSDKLYSVDIKGDSYDVEVAYGRRGATQKVERKTAMPVTLAAAQQLAERIVLEKKRKGYTEDESGAAFAGTDKQGQVSGWLPQRLNPIDESDLGRLIFIPMKIVSARSERTDKASKGDGLAAPGGSGDKQGRRRSKSPAQRS